MLINGTAGLYLHSVVSIFWKGVEHSWNAAIEEDFSRDKDKSKVGSGFQLVVSKLMELHGLKTGERQLLVNMSC